MIHLLSIETPFCVQSTQNSSNFHGFKQWPMIGRMQEPVFVNDYGAQESIPRIRFRKPMYSLAGQYNKCVVVVLARQAGNRFIGSLKGLQIRAQNSLPKSP